jgi:DNA primase
MAGFSQASLDQIRAASDIVEVIGAYFPIKRAGANFTALCPFHKEKSPSFNVNPHKQIFHCFGCHKGGDVFRFVMDYENVDFPESVRRLAERARIPLEFENSPQQRQARGLKEQLLQIHEQLAQHWQGALATEAGGQTARDYLARRGVSAEAVRLFRLGYAPEAWDDTVNWARGKGFDLALVEQAGLIIRKEGSDRHYDRFRGRLMFPICDEQGRVIAFSGRILSGDEKAAKYVNSPETPIFTKGKVFFGLDKSRRALVDAGRALICEGQLDLIACFMAGVQNVVAPQGTAFTADHARILKRYVNEVVLCFDSDTAGQAAVIRVLDSLLAAGLAIRVALVPAPHDPDSFIKEQGAAAFAQLVENGGGFFDWYLEKLCATHDPSTDRGRAAVLREMGTAVRKAGDSVLADAYEQKAALRLGVSPLSVRTEWRKIHAGLPATEPPAPAEMAGVEARPQNPHEFWLLKLAFDEAVDLDWFAAHFDLDWVSHPATRDLLARRLAAHKHHAWQGAADFIGATESEPARALLGAALADARPAENPQQQLADVLLRLRNQFLDRHLTRLTQESARAGLAESALVPLLQKQQQLRRLKQLPLQPQPGQA